MMKVFRHISFVSKFNESMCIILSSEYFYLLQESEVIREVNREEV